MSSPPSPVLQRDPHSYLSLSELDSQSDSDWLDVSSRSDYGSDSELERQLPSRRSSISIGSSLSDDGEAAVGWEGLVDDVIDDEHSIPVPRSHVTDSDLVAITADSSSEIAHQVAISDLPSIDTDVPSDEERVREGLDQSMMGTLTGSRSSSAGHASARTSIRDLRLSFPDPLTSSREEIKHESRASSLNSSFEDVQASPAVEPSISSEAIESAAATEDAEDPGLLPIPVVPSKEVLCDCSINARYTLEIFLYGSDPKMKASFANEFLSKAVEGGWGSGIQSAHATGHPSTRVFHVTHQSTTHSCVAVHDISTNDSKISVRSDTPSLAIVFLPYHTYLPPSKHTLYLPVIIPAAQDSFVAGKVLRQSAVSYKFLALAQSDKILRLRKEDRSFSFFKTTDLHQLEAHHASDAVERVFDAHTRSKQPRVHHGHIKGPAGTLAGLLFLMLGVASYLAFRPSTATPPTTKTVPTVFYASQSVILHNSTALSTRMGSSVAVVPSRLKELSVAIFNQPSPPSIAPIVPTSSSSRLLTYSDKSLASPPKQPQIAKDVIVRPDPSLSIIPTITHAPTDAQSEPSTSKLPVSLSLRLPDSISEVITHTVGEARNDVHELADAFDDFIGTIQHHASVMTKQSKMRAELFQERLVERNERARGRAKQLKRKGSQLLAQAGEHLKEHATIARSRALSLREQLAPAMSDMWKNDYDAPEDDVFEDDKENVPDLGPVKKGSRGRVRKAKENRKAGKVKKVKKQVSV